MAKDNIKWNLKAFAEIRTSPEVNDMLQGVLNDIIDEVGDDLYNDEVSEGGKRSVGRVWTAGTHAERSNAKHNTLIKALSKAVDTS